MVAIPHMVHPMWLDKIQYDSISCPVKGGVHRVRFNLARSVFEVGSYLLESTKNRETMGAPSIITMEKGCTIVPN